MPDDENSGVRPTKRCLDDLGIKFPPVNQPLHKIDHPLINKAQHLPAEASAGGAERIKALTDRVWFKVKVVNLRGAATQLTPSDHHRGRDTRRSRLVVVARRCRRAQGRQQHGLLQDHRG